MLPFTRANDIVQMIQQCIDILEAETESPHFTRLQALRWLLHLVEDLHQPLHVASGYYSTAADALPVPKRIDDPATVTHQYCLKEPANGRIGIDDQDARHDLVSIAPRGGSRP